MTKTKHSRHMTHRMPRVEVVLINHRRPYNVHRILEALRDQSMRCSVTLIDDPAEPDAILNDDTLAMADTIYRFSVNFGPYCRYVPLAAYSHEFTYFHDDDMFPGSKLIEHLLEIAEAAPPFGVLGDRGRCLDSDGIYRGTPARRGENFVPVDVVVRGFFIRTVNLPAVATQRLALDLAPGPGLEDDLLLCTAQNMITGLTNYLIPRNKDRETYMCKEELSAPHARKDRDIHHSDRTAFCQRAIQSGWRPLFMRDSDANDGL